MPTPPDRYHVHAPTRAGKPRRLHPRQMVTAPTAEELRPHAATYTADALDAIHAAQQRDPTATSTRYLLPNDGQQAPAAREVIAEHLHPLGAQVGALQRTRGTRQPFAVITWPAGWTVPENPTDAQDARAEVGEENHDERSK